MYRAAKQRKSARLAALATVSLIGSASTVAFFMAFAYLHDAGRAPDVQFCMLVATGVALVTAIAPLIAGSGR